MNHSREQQSFFERGLEYYICGRYAVFSGLTSIAGNLLHHAIEMLLKGHLVAHFSMDDLRNLFGHDVKNLWGEFKSRTSASLTEFDSVILDLDKFEEIRYPDKSIIDGLALSISPSQETEAMSMRSEQYKVPHYYLTWGEIDKLVMTIFKQTSVNPRFFTSAYKGSAMEFLLLNNVFPLI